MGTHQEWLTRWADRWVGNAKAEIDRRRGEINELLAALKTAADGDQREWFESLIEQNEGIVESIRLSHRQWQRRAKRRWQLDIPELPE